MKGTHNNTVSYEVVRSRRTTADVIIERDGSILVRAPEGVDDEQIDNIDSGFPRTEGMASQEWRGVGRMTTMD